MVVLISASYVTAFTEIGSPTSTAQVSGSTDLSVTELTHNQF